VFYGHPNIQAWFEAVDPVKTSTEVLKAKEFFGKFPVAGLILKGVYYDENTVSTVYITTRVGSKGVENSWSIAQSRTLWGRKMISE